MENYIEQLTAKNSEYIHVVTRELVKIGKSDDEIKIILSDILPQIVEAQEQRVLAKDILGTPSEFIMQYAPKTATTQASKAKQNDNETPVLMWLDSSLLMLGVLALMNGMMAVFSKNAKTYGIITLLSMSFAAGFVIYLLYRLFYKPQSKGFKIPKLKSYGALTLAILIWFSFSYFTLLLPVNINVTPEGYLVAVIGALSLGTRYLLKRKYHIKSALATQPSQN
ncbi:DUF1129 domain-containing protein [Pseudolactococcus yaeyamensis]